MTIQKHPRPSTRTLRHLATSVLAAIGLLHAGVSHADSGGCQAAAITGESQVDPSTGAFVGGGTLSLSGKVLDITWVSVITSEAVNPDGSLTLGSSHHITSADSGSIDFTTQDAVTAVPTTVAGVYTFTSHLALQSGNGRLNSGFLDVKGVVDLVHGHVVINSSSGDLCATP